MQVGVTKWASTLLVGGYHQGQWVSQEMIRGLENLKCGQYIGDFRYDEGFRIREDNVCPCLSSHAGVGVSNMPMILIIEDSDEDKASD